MIKFLIEKEFKQLLRNSFLPKLILVFPCMIMLLMPWAVNMEIKNIYLVSLLSLFPYSFYTSLFFVLL